MNNVHEDAPELFQTRWTLSYLCGPLSREQVKTLMSPLKQPRTGTSQTAQKSAATARPAESARPVLPPGVPQYFLPAASGARQVTWRPVVIGAASVQYSDLKRKIDSTEEVVLLAPIVDGPVPVNWDDASPSDADASALATEPPAEGEYEPLPSAAAQPKNYAPWKRDFTAWLAANRKLTLYRSPGSGIVSTPGESERDFRVRNTMAARGRATGRWRRCGGSTRRRSLCSRIVYAAPSRQCSASASRPARKRSTRP
jgi:hypothetical protein